MAMKQLQHIAGTLLFTNFVKFGRNIKTPPLHRGAFCQFPFHWIYYYGKTHLCGTSMI
jgi:hypothetical protein